MFTLLGYLLSALPAAAQISTAYDLALGTRSPIEIALSLINWFLSILALIAVVLILYGGWLWLSSQGNEEQIGRAKRILINVGIGLLIILASWGIVLYVLSILLDATGGSSTNGDSNNGGGSGFPASGSTFYVRSTEPDDEATDVTLCTDVYVLFSKDIDTESATTSTNAADNPTMYVRLVDGSTLIDKAGDGETCAANTDCASALCDAALLTCTGDNVSGTIELDHLDDGETTDHFSFLPTTNFESNSTYQGTVVGGSTGVVSNSVTGALSLDQDYVFSFTTGTSTDTTSPVVTEISGSSPFPNEAEVNVCLNTPINFQFSEPIRTYTVDDQTSFLVSTDESFPADALVSLRSFDFGTGRDYAMTRPTAALTANTDYAALLYGGDLNTDGTLTNVITDACGNPLDGNFDGVAGGAAAGDGYFASGYDYTGNGTADDPLNWTTGENAQCTPLIESISPSNAYYGYGDDPDTSTTEGDSSDIAITGQFLAPNPEVIFNDSIYSSAGDLTCFDGDTPPDASMVCFLSASSTADHTRLPVGAEDGAVSVVVADESSECLWDEDGDGTTSCDVTVNSPYISYIDPHESAPGDYVTVSGAHFGLNTGKVYFRADAAGVAAGYPAFVQAEFPPESCGSTWSDDQIIVVVPDDYPVGTELDVQAETSDAHYSNLTYFTISDVERPSICSLSPECHDTGGQESTIVGQKFGTTSDTVTYGETAGSVFSWSDAKIISLSPTDIANNDYAVSVTVNGSTSNSVTYTVPCSEAPQVVQVSSCDEEADVYPLPNPRPGETEACLNSNVEILFDQEMDANSFNTNTISVVQCGVGDDFVASECGTTNLFTNVGELDSVSVDYSGDGAVDYYGFVLDLNDFTSQTWYQVTVNTGVTSDAGVSLSSAYTQHFRVQETAGYCDYASVSLQPTSITHNAYSADTDGDGAVESPRDDGDYTGSGYSAECLLLDSDSFDWHWTLSNPTGVSCSSDDQCSDTQICSNGLCTSVVGSFGSGPGLDNTQTVYPAGDDNYNQGTATVSTEVDGLTDTASYKVDFGYCESDSDCSNVCGGSICDDTINTCTPVVDSFSPTDGVRGTWVTINGCFFGVEKGNVEWSAGDVTYDTAWPDSALCTDSTWDDNQIVAEFPSTIDNTDTGAATEDGSYQAAVITADSLQDDSGATTFTTSEVIHPGLCRVYPERGPEGEAVQLYGQNFGLDKGKISFNADDPEGATTDARVNVDLADLSWSDSTLGGAVPTGAVSGVYDSDADTTEEEGVKVVTFTNDSTSALDFTVTCDDASDCASGICNDDGTCSADDGNNEEECSADADCVDTARCPASITGSTCVEGQCTPVIDALTPNSGPVGRAITITGCYFDSYVSGSSKVLFDGLYEADEACESNSWTDSAITVFVPEGSSTAPYAAGNAPDVTVVTGSSLTSNASEYTVSDQCVGDLNGDGTNDVSVAVPSTGIPVLCDIDPATGHPDEYSSTDPTLVVDAATKVTLEGTQLPTSNASDSAYFTAGQSSGLDTASSTEVVTSVPDDAENGNVVVTSNSCPSNGVDFTIECDDATDCAEGTFCNVFTGLCDATCSETDPVCTEATAETACGTGYGCTSGCCAERPEVVATDPDGDDTCRNSLLTITFSEAMSQLRAGGSHQTVHLYKVGSSGGAETLTETDGTLDLSSGDTVMTFSPRISLDATTEYRLVVDSEDSSDAVSSSSGLTLQGGSYEFNFSTSAVICTPDHAELSVLVNEVEENQDFDGDGVIADTDVTQGSWVYTQADESRQWTATMYDADDAALANVADLSWDWSWEPLYDEKSCVNAVWVSSVAGDTDVDLLLDADETTLGTDPEDYDTDGDGFGDGWEHALNTDPLDADVKPNGVDADGDGLLYPEEIAAGTNPDEADTDGDGYGDGWEVLNSTDPLDETSFPGVADPGLDTSVLGGDADGLLSTEEATYGTTLTDADSDDDTFLDGWEVWLGSDPKDASSVPTLADPGADSDGDGLGDSEENSLGTDEADYDTDGDGFGDGWEVEQETDPLLATSVPTTEQTLTGEADSQTVVAGSVDQVNDTVTVTAIPQTGWTGTIDASAAASVRFCNGQDWLYTDSTQRMQLWYCDSTNSLPELSSPAVTTGTDYLRQYLFPSADDPADTIGIRVYPNSTDFLTPEEWVAANVPNAADLNLTNTTVGGYPAVKSDNAVYIDASFVTPGAKHLYNNIYLVTWTAGGAAEDIANQLLEYWTFNTNVSSSNDSISPANSVCEYSSQAKLQRDTERLTELYTTAADLNTYHSAESAYPLPAGDVVASYLTNMTTSVWPSWQGALANVLGAALPEDPSNIFVDHLDSSGNTVVDYLNGDATHQCPYSPDTNQFFDETGTCWDPVNLEFYCPSNSHAYLYKVDGASQDKVWLYGNFEYLPTSVASVTYYPNALYNTYQSSNTANPYNPCNGVTGASCSCFNFALRGSSGADFTPGE